MPQSNSRRWNGVEITGAPTAGQVPVAISATEAEWADAVAGIALQLTTPGTAQTGHGNISGRFIAEAGVSVGSALYVPAHSTLRLGGSLATSFRTVNGVPFVADGDTLAIQVISTIAGAASVTLPQASTCGGRLYLIMNTSVTGFTVTLSPFLGDTINGLTSYTFNTRYESVLLQSTGTQWVIVARTGHTSGGGSGTVTSVAMTVPAEFSVSGSPITGAGTLAVTKATQNANRIFAGPTTGAAAQPTFRALVSDDIPNNAANTSGTASNITGTAAIANGGTGQTSAAAAFAALSPTTTKGDLIVDNGIDPVRLPVGSNGQVLTADSTVTEGVKWADAASGPAATAYVAYWQIPTASGAGLFTAVGAAAVSTAFDFGTNGVSDSGGNYSAYETGTIAGNRAIATWGGNTALCQHNQLPDVSVAVKTGPSASDVTGLRMWPLFLGPSNPYNVDSSNNGCGFRFSPAVAGDTSFVAYSRNAATDQTTITGITPAAATAYVFRMVVGASDIKFYINGALVATHATSVPAASTQHVFRSTLTCEVGGTTRILWLKKAYITHT